MILSANSLIFIKRYFLKLKTVGNINGRTIQIATQPFVVFTIIGSIASRTRDSWQARAGSADSSIVESETAV
jgi:hypothetical protein